MLYNSTNNNEGKKKKVKVLHGANGLHCYDKEAFEATQLISFDSYALY